MTLPLTGINTTIVAQAIGLASNNVGYLCIRSAVGGVMSTTESVNFNSAFMVAENGGTDGVMIDGAKPYFNIFSTNAPGYWYKTGSYIKYRLKNSGPDQSKLYGFSLGNFRGYDHAAIPLSFTLSAVWFQAENRTQFNGTINTGSYNWALVMAEQYGIIPVINIYSSSGFVLRGTIYAGEAYSVGRNVYYVGGDISDSQALSYVCKMSFTTLKADGTLGGTGYEVQPSGWFNPQKTVAATTMVPSDKPTETYLTVTTPVEIPITNVTINVGADPANVYHSVFNAGFKCYDYMSLTDNMRTIKIKVSNLITGETLFENNEYGTHLIRATNNISILCPVYYTEMNLVYQVQLY